MGGAWGQTHWVRIPSEIINRVPAGTDKHLRCDRKEAWQQHNGARNSSCQSDNLPILCQWTLSHCIEQTSRGSIKAQRMSGRSALISEHSGGTGKTTLLILWLQVRKNKYRATIILFIYNDELPRDLKSKQQSKTPSTTRKQCFLMFFILCSSWAFLLYQE